MTFFSRKSSPKLPSITVKYHLSMSHSGDHCQFSWGFFCCAGCTTMIGSSFPNALSMPLTCLVDGLRVDRRERHTIRMTMSQFVDIYCSSIVVRVTQFTGVSPPFRLSVGECNPLCDPPIALDPARPPQWAHPSARTNLPRPISPA